LGGEVVGFAEGSEEPVPPGNVAEVEFVNVKLVMDGMVFGALEEVAQPMRGAQIAVVKIFAEDGEDVEPRCASQRCGYLVPLEAVLEPQPQENI
jgi:hypothetical protein